MGYTRNTGQLSYLITYDGSGNITVPASFTQTTVTSSMLKADSSGKLVAAVAGTDFVAPAGLSAYVPTTRTITINGTSYDLSADRSWTIVSGVSSFNTRTGAIELGDTDVTGALGYTPVTNARTLTINGTTYDLSANRSWSIVAGLSSFNTRTGAITLLDTDVTGALGYTPVTNARTITINGTTYDLSANRTWVVDTSSVTTRVIQKFTATAAQTTFTITGGYTVGMVDVFLNGVKLDNATDFTASNGSTVVLAAGAAVNDVVEVYKYGGQFIANNTLRQTTAFTATAGQTAFTVSYSVGFVDVFYNGSKLAAAEFTATNGTSIVLGTACVLNDIVEVVAYNYTVGAFTGVGGSGTTNYIPKWTASGTLGNSLIFDNGTNIGIGTSNPSSKLYILGDSTNYGITSENPSGYGGLTLKQTNGNSWSLGVTSNNLFFYDGNAGSTRVTITSGGNFGIGTSPLTIFDVKQGSTGTATANAAFRDSSTNGNALQIWNGNNEARLRAIYYGTASDQNITFWTVTAAGNEGERMRINSVGEICIGTVTAASKVTIIKNSVYSTGDQGLRIKATDGDGYNLWMGASTNGYATIQSYQDNVGGKPLLLNPLNGGYVGIGVSNPSDVLDVQRNQNGTTNFYLRNTDTTNTNSRAYLNIHSGGVNLLVAAINGDHCYVKPTTASNLYLGYQNALMISSGGHLQYNQVPNANYNVDTSPIAMSIASGGVVNFGYFSGMIMVNNHSNGVCAVWVVGAGTVTLLGKSNSGTEGSMTYNGGIVGYTWTSTYGATANYGVYAIKTRNNA
jgi:hypothetical protein